MIRDTCEIFREQAFEKSLVFVCDVEPDTPEFIQGDPNRIQQILINLISNALKFTDSGYVNIFIRNGQNPNTLTMTVKDSGIGMSEQDMEKLFQSFSQASNSTTRIYGGTGLGLAISKQLANLMGGDITVKSSKEHGSEFTLELPIIIAEKSTFPQATTRQPNLKSLTGFSGLLVDDNDDYAQIALNGLEHYGIKMERAKYGEQAIELFKNSINRQKPYDFILIDLEMPGMNGIELFHHLKEKYELPPCALVSASANIKSQENIEDEGFQIVSEKPLISTEFPILLLKLLGLFTQEAENTNLSNSIKTLDGMCILLAEDNKINQMVMNKLLNNLGCKIEVADNGKEAIKLYKQKQLKSKNLYYHSILMDCEMPEMDGYMATQTIRQLELSANRPATPIFALTAHVLPEYIERCKSAGMDSVISKPIDTNSLSQLLMATWHNTNVNNNA